MNKDPFVDCSIYQRHKNCVNDQFAHISNLVYFKGIVLPEIKIVTYSLSCFSPFFFYGYNSFVREI